MVTVVLDHATKTFTSCILIIRSQSTGCLELNGMFDDSTGRFGLPRCKECVFYFLSYLCHHSLEQKEIQVSHIWTIKASKKTPAPSNLRRLKILI